MIKICVTWTVLLVGSLSGSVMAEGSLNGAELFNHHGCINCHGADGNTPVSKLVPKLGGKPADELFARAKKVLTGKGATEQAQLMHAAFYSPSQCDSPPTDAELHAITAWISQL